MKYLLQIRNFVLFLAGFIVLFFSGGRRCPLGQPPQKILVVQLAKLGDMVCTTPMFRAIKRKYPSSKVYVVGDTVNQKILEGNIDVDSYIIFDHGHIWDVINKIQAEKFDFACTTGPDFLSLVLLVFSRIKLIAAPRVVGGEANQTRTYSVLQRFVCSSTFRMGTYAPRERLRLLEHIGIYTEDTDKHLSFSKEASASIKTMLESHTGGMLVGIAPGVGNTIKEWPAERFGVIAEYMLEKHNASIVLIGGPKDASLAETVVNGVTNQKKVINTVGEVSIDELKALISELNLFIAVDTGPIYIAEAFGVPTIDIVGPMDEREQPPIGKKHVVVVPPERSAPATHIFNSHARDKREARRQALSITSDMVIKKVEKLWEDGILGN